MVPYVYNKCFDDPKMRKIILAPMPNEQEYLAKYAESNFRNLASTWSVPILSKDQEQHLFRKMNYCKHRMNKGDDQFAEIASSVRDLLVKANFKLIAARLRYVKEYNEFSDKFSEGELTILKAVDKFDYSRDLKFSTYATWALIKNFSKVNQTEKKKNQAICLSELPETAIEEDKDEGLVTEENKKIIEGLLVNLGKRTKHIIASKSGIEPYKTDKQLARELHVAKSLIKYMATLGRNKMKRMAKRLYPNLFKVCSKDTE